MERIGIIGSGAIGSAIARLAVAADLEVVISNSRDPDTLATFTEELGPRARGGTPREAAAFGELTVLAVPLSAYERLPIETMAGRTVLSTGNYYPSRDGRVLQLDTQEMTTAEYEQALLPGSRIVKAFNNIVAHHIPLLAITDPRTALALAGDDDAAKQVASGLVEELGFDTVDAGDLSESWRFEPESGAYTAIYAASPNGFGADYLADRGSPLGASRLRDLLAGSTRPDVAARTF